MDLAVLDGLFKFQIGSWVRHKQDSAATNPMMVVSRELEQCYGGVQAHYYVRLYGRGSGSADLCPFNEIELAPATKTDDMGVPALLQALKERLVEGDNFVGAADVRGLLERLGAQRPE